MWQTQSSTISCPLKTSYPSCSLPDSHDRDCDGTNVVRPAHPGARMLHSLLRSKYLAQSYATRHSAVRQKTDASRLVTLVRTTTCS